MPEQAFRRQIAIAGDAGGGTKNEQFRPLETPLPAIPEPHRLTLAAFAYGSAGFVRRKRRASPAALLVSMLITAALLSLMLLVPGVTVRVRPVVDAMVVISLKQDAAAAPKQLKEEQPVDQPEVYADSPEEASPSSRELAVAPSPKLPEKPLPDIQLSKTPLQQTPITGHKPTVMPGANSNGDQPQGALGFGGRSGNGIDGDGSGGAGGGKGEGSKLIASWAPNMDFSLLNYYYPRRALNAKIEGAVWLSCFVPRFRQIRECKLLAESPTGYGFGKAALRARRSFRVEVHNQSGRRVYNEWVTIRSHFILPEPETSEAEIETGD